MLLRGLHGRGVRAQRGAVQPFDATGAAAAVALLCSSDLVFCFPTPARDLLPVSTPSCFVRLIAGLCTEAECN